MNRVVRGSSLLIVTAIVAACAAQRDEGKAAAGPAGARSRSSPRPRRSTRAWPRQRRASGARAVVATVANSSRVTQDRAAVSRPRSAAPAALVASYCCRAAVVPAADEHRALPAPRRQSGAPRRRAAGLDVLDRRRHRRVRQRAPLPQRRPAAAAGRGARRGDDQLLRLSLCAAGEPRRAVPRGHGSGAGAVESAGAAHEDRHQGIRSRGRRAAAGEPGVPDRRVGLDAVAGQAAAAQERVPPAHRPADGARPRVDGRVCRQLGRRARADAGRSEAQDPRGDRPPRSRRLDQRRRRHRARLSARARCADQGRHQSRRARDRRRLQRRRGQLRSAGRHGRAAARRRRCAHDARLRHRQLQRSAAGAAGGCRQRQLRVRRHACRRRARCWSPSCPRRCSRSPRT